MKSLDSVIAKMKSSGCIECQLDTATHDESGEVVSVKGSFCTPAPEYAMIYIYAVSKKTNIVVWDEECDTNKKCDIPFSSEGEFECF